MITIRNLTKQFSAKPVFNNFSAEYAQSRLCIQANNGMGKTTLFRIVAGLDDACSGEVLFDGIAVKNHQTVVALASDCIPFPEFLTAKELLSLSCRVWECAFPDELVERFQFSSFLQTKYAALSSGNKKKLQLINAICRNTPYLLLDEPTAALDHHGVEQILSLVDTFQGQILLTSHEPEPFLQHGFALKPLF
ncbi:ABC transporter ATP-binding protein [Pseudoalteromonas sp. T1lg65]|uniref:ABC transporter ATP-binding protein n=1 Tax=Pseudoalteromonas sp. T1lg65 TaxID=2077101 RepID=UPI003F7ADDFD